jgi:hypothetical protein
MATYVALWKEGTDEATRLRLAEQAMTEDAEIIYPGARASGRNEIVAAIAAVYQSVPGARIFSTSGVEQHHGWLRATWRMLQSDGTVLLDGMDVAELAEDGRFRRVIGFHEPLPAPS